MDIKDVIESVVQFGGGTTAHRHVIDINHGAATREQVVHLSNDPKLKRSQIAQHIDKFTSEMKATFPEHTEGSRKINEPHEVVNHVYAHQWFDHPEDESRNMYAKHKFIPLKNAHDRTP